MRTYREISKIKYKLKKQTEFYTVKRMMWTFQLVQARECESARAGDDKRLQKCCKK